MINLPKVPKVPIESIDKYRWAYVVMVFAALLFFFVGAFVLTTRETKDACEEDKAQLRRELNEYKIENRALLTANYLKSAIIHSLDSLSRNLINEQDVKRTVESNPKPTNK